ncbi:MAG: hypothetical protein H5U37_08020 [Caldisericia bacterium]|nr:hypothetical protein [Caldisericia bacterium]
MNNEKCLIVVGEGGIPLDFPKKELSYFLILKAKIESNLDLSEEERRVFEELKNRLKNWERNFRNDEYYHSLFDLSNYIERRFKIKTYFAFLDFSEPDLIKSIDNAIKEGFKKIFIVSLKLILKKEDYLKIKDEIDLIKMKYSDVKIYNFTNLDLEEISNFLINLVENKRKIQE